MGVGGGRAWLKILGFGFPKPFLYGIQCSRFFSKSGLAVRGSSEASVAPVLMPVVVASRYKSAVIRVERALKLQSLFVTLPRESKP